MKKKIISFTLIAIAAIVYYTNYRTHTFTNLTELGIANIEALANNDEYVIGPVLSNWKEYRVECTRTIGFDWVLKIEKTTTYWTDACGSGSGWCMSPAGC